MYARILVPIDGSPTADRGLGEAIRLARAMKGRIVALTVSAGFVGAMEMASARDYEASSARQLEACTDLVDAAASRARDAGVECDKVVADNRGRSVAQTILDECATWNCELVVMGTHGRRGLTRMVLGSDAEAVLRGARTPVMLVRASEAH